MPPRPPAPGRPPVVPCYFLGRPCAVYVDRYVRRSPRPRAV